MRRQTSAKPLKASPRESEHSAEAIGHVRPDDDLRSDAVGGASPGTARPSVALVVPGLVVAYALLGALWHPILLGPGGWDSFECPSDPWFFVLLGSWLFRFWSEACGRPGGVRCVVVGRRQ
jgi:hypothetical protein